MAKNYFLAIFYDFGLFEQNRFFEVFGGPWGPGMILERLGMLKQKKLGDLISALELGPAAVS